MPRAVALFLAGVWEHVGAPGYQGLETQGEEAWLGHCMSEGSLEVRNKLKATILSLSGHVDPFNLRAEAAGAYGAERLR